MQIRTFSYGAIDRVCKIYEPSTWVDATGWRLVTHGGPSSTNNQQHSVGFAKIFRYVSDLNVTWYRSTVGIHQQRGEVVFPTTPAFIIKNLSTISSEHTMQVMRSLQLDVNVDDDVTCWSRRSTCSVLTELLTQTVDISHRPRGLPCFSYVLTNNYVCDVILELIMYFLKA